MVTLKDLRLADKRVLIREDLNVPMKDRVITDASRIDAALPTLKHALGERARVLVVSHLGRPTEGEPDANLSLAPVARHLGAVLGRDVRMVEDWIGGVEVDAGELVLCENVRFLKGERQDDDELARRMAALCDVYCNDAFATAHRAEASTHSIAKYAPQVCMGPLLAAEIAALRAALKEPARPVVAIVGGSKVSTKLNILESLLKVVDQLVVAGGISNTFLKAAGNNIGQSLCEDELLDVARRLLRLDPLHTKIPLPLDVTVAKKFSEDAPSTVKDVDALLDDDMILDIGPRTADRNAELIARAGTIIWNGPVGVFEFDRFGQGTRRLAEAIADADAFSIAGGGDTVAAIAKYGVGDRISYISTGGGAFLEFLEGKTLPAIAILEERFRSQPDRLHPSEGY